jgi:ribonuclease P protein component
LTERALVAPMEQIDQKFPKSDRILKRGDFRKVYDGGRKSHGRLFTAFVLDSSRGGVRIGLTVTRKVGASHERNRCRRRLREAFRRHRAAAGAAGVDIVINARREMLGATSADVEAEMVKLLTRIAR